MLQVLWAGTADERVLWFTAVAGSVPLVALYPRSGVHLPPLTGKESVAQRLALLRLLFGTLRDCLLLLLQQQNTKRDSPVSTLQLGVRGYATETYIYTVPCSKLSAANSPRKLS